MTNAIFIYGSGYAESVKNHRNTIPLVNNFTESKIENPIRPYGHSDYSFSNDGFFAGFRHAKLTQDLSIVYKLTGSHPRVFKMYGVYSHAELGTGTPPNPRKQKSAGKSLNNQTFT